MKAAGEDALFAEASGNAEQDMADLAKGAREEMVKRFVDFWNKSPGMFKGLPGHIRERLLNTADGIVDDWRALLADLHGLTLPTLVLGGDRTYATLERIAQIAAAENHPGSGAHGSLDPSNSLGRGAGGPHGGRIGIIETPRSIPREP